MNKCDFETKRIIRRLLTEGRQDIKPRPHYEDEYYNASYKNGCIVLDSGESITVDSNQWVENRDKVVVLCTPAHTLSYNHEMITYDLSKKEFPISTLRPTAIRSAIAEIVWIYFRESNDLVVFDDLLGKNTWDENHIINNWWKDWAIRKEDGSYDLNELGHPHIGCCYGETIRRHNLMKKLLSGISNDPDGRRHIINMWQEDDFEYPHGLKPCAYQTVWNVRHESDGDYLDMCLFQRSSDFLTAGVINQAQYAVLLIIVASIIKYNPGKFTWFVDNIQCYDRHIENAKELLSRQEIECDISVVILQKYYCVVLCQDLVQNKMRGSAS